MPSKKNIKTPRQLWENVSSRFVHFVEQIFFILGVHVGRHPVRTIILSWTFVILSGVGLMKFHIEKNPMKLWVPSESDFYRDTYWYVNQFGTAFRLQRVLVEADDVLQPDVLQAIYNITEQVNTLRVRYDQTDYSINELCYKVPAITNFFNFNTKSVKQMSDNSSLSKENKNSDSEFTDPTSWIGEDFYCGFIENFPMTCLQHNIVDLFKNDLDLNKGATKHDIVSKINSVKTNPVSGHDFDYTELLGGVSRDESGNIVAAKSVILTWYTEVNMSAVDLNQVGNLVGTEDWVTVPLGLWEQKYVDLMVTLSNDLSNITLYYEAGRSFGDVSGDAIIQELSKLFIGILLMFMYIQFGLSRCNWLEVRLTLGSVGLLCVGMAYISAVGWCSIIGISFGPVHSSLPFLLMGLGVDDMFVMQACWENLSEADSQKSIPYKVGLMLKHAGVSIVITSFTDIVALLIGAITILPSLKSFCIYAAFGVFFIFCYSVTFYVAVFTLDIKRIEANRNGILFCYRHKSPVSLSKDKTTIQKLFAKFYTNVVLTTPGKIIVIIFTLTVTGFSIEAILKLEQRFDPKWFIPEYSDYKQYLNAHDYYYPEEGHTAMIFLGEMDYRHELSHLHNLTKSLEKKSYVKDVVSWLHPFHGYVQSNFHLDVYNSTAVSEEQFNLYLSKFLFSPIGGRYQMNLKFTIPFKCGQSATTIKASHLSFKFTKFNGPDEYIPAMNQVKDLVQNASISSGDGYRSVWSKVFANWVTDEIIAVEVERNVELALLCVMVCTAVLITNLQMCFWIFMCVLLTIVNVLGFMQRWGMTVDIVCCIGLELAIGLCVDYAAHVGHTFLTIPDGSRSDRAFKTITAIGGAVLLGGGATLLSFSLLSMSQAYTFQTFAKIFLLVIIFGLFNGLVFLPVILSLIGPAGYKSNVKEPEEIEMNGKQHALETE
ncbi:protein patched homolog 1-like [Cydia strobilella]|uniref:protein patched homolog 1-like n=1 Tax=Cydia strobilella TaxID=1100964 RepID=UPI003004EA42